MSRLAKLFLLGFFILIIQSCTQDTANKKVKNVKQKHAKALMSGAAILPADLSNQSLTCQQVAQPELESDYLTAEQIDYSKYGWEQRITNDWRFFSAKPSDGKIHLIDIKKINDAYGYKYLSNGTQDQLFEPWSSSKVMAISAALAKARAAGLKNASKVGQVPLADLITSIHNYDEFGQSKASSNAIATFFINFVGREKLTRYYKDDWLKLANSKVRIRGGYGEPPFQPQPNLWYGQNKPDGIEIAGFASGADDPFAQSYRCKECGLTGNKPQTTLAMAEWLKRLALHDREVQTNFPMLDKSDVQKLFYGIGHSAKNEKMAGMMKGIGQGLAYAIANTIGGERQNNPKALLDKITQGKWRIWQKIGWGPSETRGAAEYVLLAHVCLPHYQGGREFTLSAQVGIDGATEADELQVGMKMQSLLVNSMKEYFEK